MIFLDFDGYLTIINISISQSTRFIPIRLIPSDDGYALINVK